MLKMLCALATLLCLTSCATVFNRKVYKVRVSTYEPNRKAEINDSVYTLPAYVKVPRSKEDLHIKLIGDNDSVRHFVVKPSIGPGYIYGNLCFMQMAPAGYLLDLATKKRFYYGRRILLNMDAKDSVILTPVGKYFSKKFDTKKGEFLTTISVPYVNSLYQQPAGEGVKSNVGCFGLIAGFEYFYKDNRFVKLGIGFAQDFPAPIPFPARLLGDYEAMNATNFTLTHNHNIDRLRLGYGVTYSMYKWSFVPDVDFWGFTNGIYRESKSRALGLNVNGHFRITDKFLVGLSYTPTLYNVHPTAQFCYQHAVSFEISYIIPGKDLY